MIEQSIMWTALPRSIAKGSGNPILSIFVSPQLKTDVIPEQLGQFKDFLDWPATLAQLKFQATVGGTTFDCKPFLPDPKLAPESKLWQSLFTKTTYVRPYQFDKLDDRLIFSYPMANVLGYLKQVYQAFGASEEFPGVEQLAKDLGSINTYRDPIVKSTVGVPQEQSIIETLRPMMSKMGAIPPGPPNPSTDFAQLQYFFAPKNKKDPDTPAVHNKVNVVRTGQHRKSAIAPPEMDFHQMVSMLGAYPSMLRRLGLVFDVEVIPGGGAFPATGQITVVPIWPNGLPSLPKKDRTPRTAFKYSDAGFIAQPRQAMPEVAESGVMRLSDPFPDGKQPLYHLVQVDVQGMAMKLQNFAYNLSARQGRATTDSPTSSSIPAPRTSGISIVRTGRALRLATMLKSATQKRGELESGTDPLFHAEDLIRGYRVDLFDAERNQWFSLHQRTGSYQFTEAGITEEHQDEGFIQTATTESADGTSTDLFLPESMGTWEGWSLSVPRPGAAVDNDGKVVRAPNEFSEDFKLRTSFRVAPGSLPMLRFGKEYRVRLRAVDLAGNGPTVKSVPPSEMKWATPPMIYRRFEPISHPFVVLKSPIDALPGESLERLVIRSMNSSQPLDTTPTDATSQRHVAPPAIAQLDAETHGVFDLPADDLADDAKLIEQYEMIASKEGRFKQLGSAGDKNPPNPIATEDQITELPYLPDPLAEGVILFNAPGVPAGNVVMIPGKGGAEPLAPIPGPPTPAPNGAVAIAFREEGAWHRKLPFRIRLSEGAAAKLPDWNDAERVLTLFLPKGEVLRCRYASVFGKKTLKLLGVWNWIEELNPPKLSEVAKLAQFGRLWMLTPHRTLELVHATQQPLGIPKFDSLGAHKSLGQTYATLGDKLLLSCKSTARVEVRAEWEEPVDPLSKPKWEMIPGKATICELLVDDPKAPFLYFIRRHEFGDTKYRKVRYFINATTRFREYLPPELLAEDPNDPAKVEKNISRNSEMVEKKILNSARPDAPKLLYILPTFGWQTKTEGTGIASARKGGGLRVYLDRPWFSSGDEERLGVLIWTGPFSGIPKQYLPYVTQWGADPIWSSLPPSGSPSAADFKAWHQDRYGVSIEEVPESEEATEKTTLATKQQQQAIVQAFLNSKKKKASAGSEATGKETSGKEISAENKTGKAATRNAELYMKSLQPRFSLSESELQVSNVRQVADKLELAITADIEYVPAKPTLAVLGHKVEYDEVRQLWYCDLQIDAGPSYYPFIRLALVRYQPNSVKNAFVSRVVLADFAQIAPDRLMTINSDPGNPRKIGVAIAGLTFNKSEAQSDGGDFEVVVETRRSDISDPDLGWVPVPDANIQLLPHKVTDMVAPLLWSGVITLPEPRGSRPYRLVVKEYERHINVEVAYKTGGGAGQTITQRRYGRRVVYADAIEL